MPLRSWGAGAPFLSLPGIPVFYSKRALSGGAMGGWGRRGGGEGGEEGKEVYPLFDRPSHSKGLVSSINYTHTVQQSPGIFSSCKTEHPPLSPAPSP